MVVELKEITAENWEACIHLEPEESQKTYVASNLYSLAESKFFPSYLPFAVYAGQEIVGFVMYGIDPDDQNYWIYRLMIDQKHQRKGYGKAAILEVIERIKSNPVSRVIMIGFHPGNHAAEQLYSSAGFRIGEKAPWGERLGRYHLTTD
jgi:diamine N-acetyltransferase